MKGDIKFYLRQRPIKSKEGLNIGASYCQATSQGFKIHEPQIPDGQPIEDQIFLFDGIMDFNSTNQECAQTINVGKYVDGMMQGRNCLMLAYGQEGSGKTQTLFGHEGGQSNPELDERGVSTDFVTQVFD